MSNLVDPISVNAFGSSAHWPKPVKFEQPAERITAATSRGQLTQDDWMPNPYGVREEGKQHRQYRSRGF